MQLRILLALASFLLMAASCSDSGPGGYVDYCKREPFAPACGGNALKMPTPDSAGGSR